MSQGATREQVSWEFRLTAKQGPTNKVCGPTAPVQEQSRSCPNNSSGCQTKLVVMRQVPGQAK